MKCTLPNQKELYYELSGSEYEETVLFLNGLTQSTVAWKGIIDELEGHFQFLTCDFLFQGQSDKTGPMRSLEEHTEDIFYLLDELKLEKVHLVAISFGGFIAQRLLFQQQERFDIAILLSSIAEKTPRFKAIEAVWQKAIKQGGLELLFDVMYPMALDDVFYDDPPMPVEEMKKLSIKANETQAIQKLMDAVLLAEDDYSENLKKVKTRVWVIQGERDIICPPEAGEYLADLFSNGDFHLMRGYGHTLNLEAISILPDKIFELL